VINAGGKVAPPSHLHKIGEEDNKSSLEPRCMAAELAFSFCNPVGVAKGSVEDRNQSSQVVKADAVVPYVCP